VEKAVRIRPNVAISRSLVAVRALWQLTNDAVNDGYVPRPLAASLEMTSCEIVAALEALKSQLGPRSSAELDKCIQDGATDLEALGELSGLAIRYELTPRNEIHLAQALRYTAENALRMLRKAERILLGWQETGSPGSSADA